MAIQNCSACSDIRETAPELFVNGLTDDMITSLQNNTGLSTTNDNDDCDDLNNMTDCLIGNMEPEIDSYEVCDWKEYMRNFVPNVWTVLKGIVAAICGLWTRLTTVEEIQSDMCALLDQVSNPALNAYGILPLATSASAIARRCGTATSNVIMMPDDSTLNPYTKAGQNIGISYASMTIVSCSDPTAQEMLEWIAPSHYYYKLASGIESGAILWKISKTDAQSVIGISDYLWNVFVQSSWTWHESALTPSRQIAWMKLTVGENGLGDDELGIVFMGCSAPNNAISADQQIGSFNNASAKLYRHSIS